MQICKTPPPWGSPNACESFYCSTLWMSVEHPHCTLFFSGLWNLIKKKLKTNICNAFLLPAFFSRLGMTFQSLWQLPLWSIPARPTGASNINLAQNCVFIAFYWTECCWTLSILLLETGLSRMVQTVRWDISKITHQLFFTFLHFAGRAGSDSDCQNNGGENCQCCQR